VYLHKAQSIIYFQIFIMKKLSKDEMKKVMGGLAQPTCQALVIGGQGDPVVIEGQTASSAANAPNMIHWCCDSCCTASWAYHDGC